MPTYRQITDHVRQTRNFVPKPCWIAHIKADYGLTTRIAYNRQDPRYRTNPCPPDKRKALESAMRELGAWMANKPTVTDGDTIQTIMGVLNLEYAMEAACGG